jgi:hypothetical protein
VHPCRLHGILQARNRAPDNVFRER